MFNEDNVLRTTIILTIFLSICALIWNLQISLGLFLGGIISALAFRLMIIDASTLLYNAIHSEVSQKSARKSSFKSFLKRCSLYAMALVASLLSPYLNFYATFAGLLMPRLAILYHSLKERTKYGT